MKYSPREKLIIEIQTRRLRELLRWRSYLPILVEAVKSVLGEDVEVYVFGSAVEGRLTIDSDIDVAVVVEELPGSASRRVGILNRIWSIMEDNGVPWWYPFEIHLMTREELKLLREVKFVKAEDLIRSNNQ
ncbi:MAG: nucleotidyltransferase domain-containing protein [Desulfurococcales archaeon]|jgi:predicted nucleotidyltransferase